jgi:hypothetical protein
MRNVVVPVVVSLLAVSVTACSEADSAVPSLDTIRAMNERFADVDVALAAGYVPDTRCVDATMVGLPAEEGAMGVHYMRMDLLNMEEQEPRFSGFSRNTDFLQPSILLYEPQADGSMVLVGVENVVFESAWNLAAYGEPPSFRGVRYAHMADDSTTAMDEAHGWEPHYELHVWLFRENPSGVFAEFNPNVTCEHFRAPAGGPPM